MAKRSERRVGVCGSKIIGGHDVEWKVQAVWPCNAGTNYGEEMYNLKRSIFAR